MPRSSLIFACVLWIAVSCPLAPAQSVSPRAVLDKYCVSCHNQSLKTAGLMLDKADVEHPGTNSEIWEKVLRKIRAGEMPPPGRPRPDTATYTAMTSFLEKAMDEA